MLIFALTLPSSGQGPVTVLTPNGGESFAIGGTLVVTWKTDTAKVRNVVIDISADNGFSWASLVEGSTIDLYSGKNRVNPAWGRFDWRIPDSLKNPLDRWLRFPSNECHIKVWDPYGNLDSDKSDASFTIAAPASAVGRRLHPPDGFSVYPHPTWPRVSVWIPGGARNARLFDLSGKAVDFQNGRATPRTYILTAQTRNGGISRRAVITK